ncbi:MAG: DEAD/DEAH box helicase [Planctomycetaceae bacterium]|nr:DEAD/DEAH box helicase [Planctomycetaceae bacterium]
MSDDPFALLAEPIRRVLWDMRWDALRPVQERAIPVILETDNDLLISARTAAGKTEAAFLPILSRICENPSASVRAIYVGPLKALINDQFQRVEELCRHARIPVHRWHGDVSAGKKRELLNKPGGVLLITPESIESLFVNQSSSLGRLFHSLSFVVIDELHSLIDCERGTHLRSLLFRLERHCVSPYRLIALSATLGDLDLSARWLRPDSSERVRVLAESESEKAIRYGIFGYLRTAHDVQVSSDLPEQADRSSGRLREQSELDETPPARMTDDLYRAFRDARNLIFANARADVEWFGDQLNQYAAKDGIPGRFLVHHGSLSRQIREHTELQMQGDAPFTTVCSATLELGIDIGNVVAVGQIGCPWSVGSLIQRLGRSGREDSQPHCMRMYIACEEPGPDASLCDRLFPELLQSIALTELMLQKWVEPPTIAQRDFSTLTQQILSVIAETGGLPAKELFDRLVTHGAFRGMESGCFSNLLRTLGRHDLIEQMLTSDLILGLAGEQIVRHYDFYSAFATPPEYRVIHGSTTLGMLPSRDLPAVGDHILLGARRWQVVSREDRRKEISVVPGRGRKKPKFQGAGGDIHSQVRKTMRELLFDNRPVAYLNRDAVEMLYQARTTATNAGLREDSLVAISPSRTLWLTWTGTKAHSTLALMSTQVGLDYVDHERFALEFPLPKEALRTELSTWLRRRVSAIDLADLEKGKHWRKYDEFLSDDLLTLSFASDRLDIDGAVSALQSVCASNG